MSRDGRFWWEYGYEDRCLYLLLLLLLLLLYVDFIRISQPSGIARGMAVITSILYGWAGELEPGETSLDRQGKRAAMQGPSEK